MAAEQRVEASVGMSHVLFLTSPGDLTNLACGRAFAPADQYWNDAHDQGAHKTEAQEWQPHSSRSGIRDSRRKH